MAIGPITVLCEIRFVVSLDATVTLMLSVATLKFRASTFVVDIEAISMLFIVEVASFLLELDEAEVSATAECVVNVLTCTVLVLDVVFSVSGIMCVLEPAGVMRKVLRVAVPVLVLSSFEVLLDSTALLLIVDAKVFVRVVSVEGGLLVAVTPNFVAVALLEAVLVVVVLVVIAILDAVEDTPINTVLVLFAAVSVFIIVVVSPAVLLMSDEIELLLGSTD